ncbi:MAG TPA: tetratricopeptide repeat protein [Longimicrobiales bacterium]
MSEGANLDLQRWSEEVARDPASPAFLSLARAYRRQGRRDAALRICLRALERQPSHVEGHVLLALLYLETGDREKASDEWATVLRLDPGNFDAHRGLGFHYLERRDHDAARRHLERAAAVRPDDPAVRDALALALSAASGASSSAAGAARPAPPAAAAGIPVPGRDPARVFEELLDDSTFLGALVLDLQGLVTAGTLAVGGRDRAERIGAAFGDAIEEAARLAGVLGLGAWRGVLVHTDAAQLHVAPIGGELTLVVAGAPDAPPGWMLRTSARASELARAFVGDTHE